jgi:hypothetical protein
MKIPVTDQNEKEIEELGETKNEFAKDIIQELLGDFNWRTRQTVAYFAAVNDLKEFEETI